MLLIIGHHLILHGFNVYVNDPYNKKKYGYKAHVSLFFKSGGKIGVNLFFIISGYFYINKKTISLAVVIWETIFYGILSAIIGLLSVKFGYELYNISEKDFNKKNILLIFNPVTGNVYWFVTVYIIIIAFSPNMNKFLKKLNKIGYTLFLLLFYGLWYIFSYKFGAKYIEIKNALFFYCLGGFFRLHMKKSNLVFIFINLFIAALGFYLSMEVSAIKFIIGYVLSSFGIFRFFEGLNIGSIIFINLISQSTFAVYLIHESFTSKNFIWKTFMNCNSIYKSNLFMLYVLIIIFSIFFICIVIDKFQKKFIEPYALNIGIKISSYLKSKFFNKENEEVRISTINST